MVMYTRKTAALVIALFLVFFYFLLSSFFAISYAMPSIMEFLSNVSEDPAMFLSPDYFFVTVTVIVLAIIWIFILVKFLKSLEDYFGRKIAESKQMSELDKEQENIGILLQVAEREFFQRRINEDTFNEIRRMVGKRMVDVKAKRKKLMKDKSQPVQKEPQQA